MKPTKKDKSVEKVVSQPQKVLLNLLLKLQRSKKSLAKLLASVVIKKAII